jgi:DNA helicase IV
LDEAQDYPKGAARIFARVTERLFVTGDHQQRINNKTEKTMKEFEQLAKEAIELDRHYRNGRAICDVVGALRGYDYAASSGYNEAEDPSRFERHRCGDLREQVYQAIAMIPRQLDAYPEDLVGIIVPTNEQLMEVMRHIDGSDIAGKVQLQHSKEGYAPLDPKKRVIALNSHNSKGLEFRSAHFLGVDALSTWPDKPKTRNLVFTALTRAKTSLDVYHSNELPYWLESAVLKVTTTPKAPSKFSDVFGKARPSL